MEYLYVVITKKVMTCYVKMRVELQVQDVYIYIYSLYIYAYMLLFPLSVASIFLRGKCAAALSTFGGFKKRQHVFVSELLALLIVTDKPIQFAILLGGLENP